MNGTALEAASFETREWTTMRKTCALAASAFLVGCGGGGSAPETAQPPQMGVDLAAVAVYQATVRGGPVPIFQTLVVGPTGRSAIYYADGFDSSRGFVDVAIMGSGGTFTATLTDFAQTGVFSGSAAGAYRVGSGVSANVSYPGQTYSIDYLFKAYPTDASGPTAAAGTWSSKDERGGAQSITIAGGRNGTFTVGYGATCTVTGTTAFGDNNSNVLQVASLAGTAAGTGCRFGTGSVSGLLLVSAASTKTPSIVGHLVRSDLKDGFMFSSYRCSDGSTRTVAPVFQC
jgi:hypothetical protein